MEPTLKELRQRIKEFRSKIAGAPVSKASAEQLKNELGYYERAEKAEASRAQRLANLQKGRESKASEGVPEKKKSVPSLVKMEKAAVPVAKANKKLVKRLMESEDD
jgi:hypothetical protein